MKEPRKKKKRINMFWYIWLCILTFAVLGNITYSRFVSKFQSDDNSLEIAKPIVTISKTTLDDANNNSTKRDVSFSIQNYHLDDENQVSGTTMTYSLNITPKTSLPLTYILYKTEGDNRQPIELTNNTTSSYILPHSMNTEHNYILELTFTAPPSNEDIQNAVSIILSAEQKQ